MRATKVLFVPLVFASLANLAVFADPDSFQSNGRPVHPGCVRELLICLADRLPVVAAIDIEGCQRSNKYSSNFTTEGNAVIFNDGGSYFRYEYLGCTPKGTHVLKTLDGGEGTGVFMDIAFVRFVSDRFLDGDGYRTRTLMQCVGQIGLGDRDNGSVELKGNVIKIGKSRYRDKDAVVKVD